MIIAIWGCGGVGKSTLASALGRCYAETGTVGIIDTDLCKPTLPSRLPDMKLNPDYSLGRFLNGLGTIEIAKYFHQHPKDKGLFYAGLTDSDKYMSYEMGLERSERAAEFVSGSAEMFDTLILDCSTQRTDPFLPVMLKQADQIILPLVPDASEIHWYSAIRDMLAQTGVLEKTIPVATMIQRFHVVDEVEKQLGITFIAKFNYTDEIACLLNDFQPPTDGLRRRSAAWTHNLVLLHGELLTRQARANYEANIPPSEEAAEPLTDPPADDASNPRKSRFRFRFRGGEDV